MAEEEKKEIEEKEEGAPCEKCEEHKANWKRALADYKNLQNEIARCKSDWAKMSEAQILQEFIPVYDNLKRGLAVSLPLLEGEKPEEQRGWEQLKQGIEYVKKQFGEVLKAHGVEEIKTIGEQFDPRWHEAVGEEEADGAEAGAIVREVDSGYKVGDRVIKPAKVIVAK
ncbi:nucleotide exchange factor GrpE [Patescibacteria group bacterium]|nr:MAG: nucleotide exchange factor GrpE [Patescibacteria group bacterium]